MLQRRLSAPTAQDTSGCFAANTDSTVLAATLQAPASTSYQLQRKEMGQAKLCAPGQQFPLLSWIFRAAPDAAPSPTHSTGGTIAAEVDSEPPSTPVPSQFCP